MPDFSGYYIYYIKWLLYVGLSLSGLYKLLKVAYINCYDTVFMKKIQWGSRTFIGDQETCAAEITKVMYINKANIAGLKKVAKATVCCNHMKVSLELGQI